MSYADITVGARRALLDALEALKDHRDALVLVGAHAIHLYTGDADVPIATSTRDSDLAIIPSALSTTPRLEEAMRAAGFRHEDTFQPGYWLSPRGVPVELLVPAGLHDGGGRRGARIPPHSFRAARVVTGLEAAAADYQIRPIPALELSDPRTISIKVASPAALVVAKLHKIGERHDTAPSRLLDKDAHDLYRLLRATETGEVATAIARLRADPLAGDPTRRAMEWLRKLCETTASPLPIMAGRTETLIGDPAAVTQATWALAQDLLGSIDGS